jgi:hypothetical protein
MRKAIQQNPNPYRNAVPPSGENGAPFRVNSEIYNSGGRFILGMMISRRPKRRASSENAPGPRNAIAAAIITAKIADGLASNRFGVETGIRASAIPIVPSPTRALTIGVRNPISSDIPAAIASAASGQLADGTVLFAVRYASP